MAIATTSKENLLTFEMYQADRAGVVLVNELVKQQFGSDNYRLFKEAGKEAAKRGEKLPEISEEDRRKVDREMYDRFGERFGVEEYLRERFWRRSMSEGGIGSVNYARGILHPDQEKRASLTTDITSDDLRPSSFLETLTVPSKLAGRVYKYEQAVVLGFGYLAGELLSESESGQRTDKVLKGLNNFFTDKLFVDKKGETTDYHIYSYHKPHTNELVGLGKTKNPPEQGLWVKSLDYPVRRLRITDAEGQNRVVLALYDPREKEVGSAVIKAKERSLLDSKESSGNGVIKVTPYRNDHFGFRFVIMEGGRPMRDIVTRNLEDLLWTYKGVCDIKEKDRVKEEHGNPSRVQFRRREVFIEGLNQPVEVIIYAFEDYIASEYEVGRFDGEKGMHDGPARNLYKLQVVSNVAPYIWPYKLHHIDHIDARKLASFEYVASLGRKQRISPSPYLDYMLPIEILGEK